MKLAVLLVAAAMAPGCEGVTVIVSTGPSPIQASAATIAVAHIDGGTIGVGDSIAGTLRAHDTAVQYQLVAPRDGTLLVRVTWQASRGAIEMRLAGLAFNTWPDMRPPLTGRIQVRAGQPYPIWIGDAAPWDYGEFDLPFVVVASLE